MTLILAVSKTPANFVIIVASPTSIVGQFNSVVQSVTQMNVLLNVVLAEPSAHLLVLTVTSLIPVQNAKFVVYPAFNVELKSNARLLRRKVINKKFYPLKRILY